MARIRRHIMKYSEIFLKGVRPTPRMKVAGTSEGKNVIPVKTNAGIASAAVRRIRLDSQRSGFSGYTKALARKAAASKDLAAIQYWVDLLAELGVMNGGNPAKPSACMKSMRPMARNAVLRNSACLFLD